MKRSIAMLIIAFAAATSLLSAQVRRGNGIVPESSIERPGRMHTNYIIYAPDGVIHVLAQPGGETPASLGCVYNLVSDPLSGCPINGTTEVPSGGSGVIVLVDAYDYPGAASDLSTFSTTFGLPQANFTTVYAQGTKPADACNTGWELEESLDIEWAHAMAPNAQIVLMEAANSSNPLFQAVKVAAQYIEANGGKGDVSMSWGGSEASNEREADMFFRGKGVVFFASSGDSPGVIYPSASPYVVSAGGTQVLRNSKGDYTGQEAWIDGGGGASLYEKKPAYQDGISILTQKRGTPDLSYDSSGGSPVAVYNSACYGGWLQVYGTSVASPALAGVINNAGTFNSGPGAEQTEIYANMGNTADFTDITTGSCGTHNTLTGWDFCTGVGIPNGFGGK